MRLSEISNNKGSYAAVTFDGSTQLAITAWMIDNNIPDPESPEDLHSTVMYSKKYIPDFEGAGSDLDWQGAFTGFELFGDDNDTLVMTFDCQELTDRFNDIMDKYHPTWDYPTFQPHITLSYNCADIDPKSLPEYTGPIIIADEYNEDLDCDWENSE